MHFFICLLSIVSHLSLYFYYCCEYSSFNQSLFYLFTMFVDRTKYHFILAFSSKHHHIISHSMPLLLTYIVQSCYFISCCKAQSLMQIILQFNKAFLTKTWFWYFCVESLQKLLFKYSQVYYGQCYLMYFLLIYYLTSLLISLTLKYATKISYI